jgi:metallo-beta-lactamase family protein
VDIRQSRRNARVVFSGDIGRHGAPILRDPDTFDEADWVVMESTYGDREHPVEQDVETQLEKVIDETVRAGGNLIIPAFAVERSQDLLYHLSRLRHAKRIPHLMVFVDSPMAVSVTEVFRRHLDLFDEESRALLKQGRHPCDFPGLVFCRTRGESKSINRIRGTAVIIAGSGMCTGGRIKHHLARHLGDPSSTVLFVGYQAHNTLGRQILEKAPVVRIHGQQIEVQARIEKINGFSGHAGRTELVNWAQAFKKPPRHIFAVHGEERVATAFAGLLQEKVGCPASAPTYMQRETLSLD